MRIRPRCFVVMPYGEKPVGSALGAATSTIVNFDAVYYKLLVPALRRAGFAWFRSSEEATSADIRTGMFYELATSDFVLADVSIFNPNVFYELGVRHGLSDRGSILVHGGWTTHPLDIAVDRSFRYDGTLFEDPGSTDDSKLQLQVEHLALRLEGAARSNVKDLSSPVYKELRGLAPPDVAKIDIERIAYTKQLYGEWANRVDTARRKGAAADIMTLAGDATNLLQAAKVLYTAAWALIGMEHFAFAEELLRAAVAADPTHVQAQAQLGLVLNRLRNAPEAAECLRRVRESDPQNVSWLGALGRVHKDMWRDTWEKKGSLRARIDSSLKHQALAQKALELYQARFDRGPNSHYAAINVLALATWLRHAAGAAKRSLSPSLEKQLADLDEVRAVIMREGIKDLEDTGDRGYWACTSLAEMALCDRDAAKAKEYYERAAHWPDRDKFDTQSMLSHLRVYKALGWEPETSRELIRLLEAALNRPEFRDEVFEKVALCFGQVTDEPGQGGSFPEEKVARLTTEIEKKLDAWTLGGENGGKTDLAVCCGGRGPEIVFAELCAKRGMSVRLLIPLPQDEFIAKRVNVPGTEWQTRFARLISLDNVKVRYQHKELGAPPPTSSAIDRGLLWCLNTARVAARRPENLHLLLVLARSSPTELRALDFVPKAEGDFVAKVDELTHLPAVLAEIDPATL
jgi:tetratricopeptide (TPR) repeat protein